MVCRSALLAGPNWKRGFCEPPARVLFLFPKNAIWSNFLDFSSLRPFFENFVFGVFFVFVHFSKNAAFRGTFSIFCFPFLKILCFSLFLFFGALFKTGVLFFFVFYFGGIFKKMAFWLIFRFWGFLCFVLFWANLRFAFLFLC